MKRIIVACSFVMGMLVSGLFGFNVGNSNISKDEISITPTPFENLINNTQIIEEQKTNSDIKVNNTFKRNYIEIVHGIKNTL